MAVYFAMRRMALEDVLRDLDLGGLEKPETPDGNEP